MEWLVVKTMLSLAGVLGLMVALTVVLKKYIYAGKTGSSAIVDVEILGQRALQPKRAVFVLKVLNKVLVVGVSEHGMQALTELTDPETIAAVEERIDARPPASRWLTWNFAGPDGAHKSFARHLQDYAGDFVRKRRGKAQRRPRI